MVGPTVKPLGTSGAVSTLGSEAWKVARVHARELKVAGDSLGVLRLPWSAASADAGRIGADSYTDPLADDPAALIRNFGSEWTTRRWTPIEKAYPGTINKKEATTHHEDVELSVLIELRELAPTIAARDVLRDGAVHTRWSIDTLIVARKYAEYRMHNAAAPKVLTEALVYRLKSLASAISDERNNESALAAMTTMMALPNQAFDAKREFSVSAGNALYNLASDCADETLRNAATFTLAHLAHSVRRKETMRQAISSLVAMLQSMKDEQSARINDEYRVVMVSLMNSLARFLEDTSVTGDLVPRETRKLLESIASEIGLPTIKMKAASLIVLLDALLKQQPRGTTNESPDYVHGIDAF